jgi:hypothetical protein
MTKPKKAYKYDVCLSFAGADRPYVKKVAEALQAAGIRTFFDEYEEVDLWGKDLFTHLDDVYSNAARYCILFISRAYKERVWTNHERTSAQARAIEQHAEYILPARFDDTEIPGVGSTTGHIDLKKHTPASFAGLIAKKVGPKVRADYLPPMPDLLFAAMAEQYESVDPVLVFDHATHFLESMGRTDPEERETVMQLLSHGCPTDLPENMHINVDLLSRITGYAKPKCIRLLSNIRSLGFYCSTRRQKHDADEIGDDDTIVVLEWHDMTTASDAGGNATAVAAAMMQTSDFAHCEECSATALRALDFSHLSSATIKGVTDAKTHKKVDLSKEFPIRFRATTKSSGETKKAAGESHALRSGRKDARVTKKATGESHALRSGKKGK